MDIIEIVDFDSNKRFSMNPETYQLTRQAQDWQPKGWPVLGSVEHAEFPRQGVVKRFTFGPNVVCYTVNGLNGPYRVRVRCMDETLKHPATIRFKKFCVISYGSISVGKIHFKFVDIKWIELLFPNWVSRIIDPTWDSLDEETSSWTFGDFLVHRLNSSPK